MTIRSRFNLIAVLIVLPSIFGVSYFLYEQSASRDLRRDSVSVALRHLATQALLAADGNFDELSDEIEAMAVRRDDGVVVFSNARGVSKGDKVSTGQLLERVTSAYPGSDYSAESISGTPGGGYVAVIKPNVDPWYLDPYVIGSGFALAFECLFSIVGIFLMLRTSSSIRGLSDAVRRMARGDLAVVLEGKGNDEVAAVYLAFDDMRRELAGARHSRSRFLMGVSHDLRTPLTSIKGYLQALEEGMAEDPVTREKFLSILKAKAELLESRIQQLIEFASLETTALKTNLVDLRLRDFLEEIARAAAEDSEVSARRFSSRIRVSSETVVKADPRLFLRALENLLSNAVRYTRPGDAIVLDAEEDSARINITVRDDGPGIPTEDRKRVFEEFYRGTRARDEEGLGLGLSIVKSIVSSHGWTVDISEDAGASFIISIPKPPAA